MVPTITLNYFYFVYSCSSLAHCLNRKSAAAFCAQAVPSIGIPMIFATPSYKKFYGKPDFA
jgi:hypothetical protein